MANRDQMTALLKGNEPLSEAAALTLRSTMDALQLDLADIDEQLASVSYSRPQLLEDRKTNINDMLNNCRNLLSPLRSLPVEILAEIFRHCFHGTTFLPRSIGDSPWNISQVCRRWRAVALSTSDLWCDLFIVLRNRGEEDTDGCFFLELLRRSGSHNLEFSLSGLKGPDILRSFVKHCSRWETVDICLPTLAMFPVVNQVHGRLTNLRTCNINFFNTKLSNATMLTGFEMAPRLETVTLDLNFSSETVLFTDVIKLPWSQLTDLTVLVTDMEPIPIILVLCPSLKRLMFDSGTDCDLPHHVAQLSTVPTQEHANLLSLTLTHPAQIPSASFPSLESFRTLEAFNGFSLISLCQLLMPSRFTLTSLELRIRSLSTAEQDDLVALLSIGSSNLTYLELSLDSFHSKFYERIFSTLSQVLYIDPSAEDHETLLPRLEVLKVQADISISHTGDVEELGTIHNLDSQFVEMLESRWVHCCDKHDSDCSFTLAVYLRVDALGMKLAFPGLSGDQLTCLEHLKACGMSLSIVWQTEGGLGTFCGSPRVKLSCPAYLR
jgi:hypothetical protein